MIEALVKTMVKSALDAMIAVIIIVVLPMAAIMFLVRPGDLPIPDVYWLVPAEYIGGDREIRSLEVDADGAPVVLYGDQSINLISGEELSRKRVSGGVVIAVGGDPRNLKTSAVTADAKVIYLSDDNEVVEFGEAGQETVLATLGNGFKPTALAYDSANGTIWFVSQGSVFRLMGDRVDEVWSGKARDIAIHGDDLYIALANPDAVFRRPTNPGWIAEVIEAGQNLSGLIGNLYLKATG